MALDQYGGYLSMPVPGGATGHFRFGQIGARWVFATPDGNAFWMRGLFNADVDDRWVDLDTKYGTANPRAAWAVEATHRMARWGLNSIGEYASGYVLPYKANVTQLPTMLLTRPTISALANSGGRVAAGTAPKDVLDAQSATFIYGGRSFPDVFDPQFAAYVNAYIPAIIGDAFWGGLGSSAWCIGIAADDADDVFGFGPGAETTSPRLHPHPAWYALCAKPTLASSAQWSQSYDGVCKGRVADVLAIALREHRRAQYRVGLDVFHVRHAGRGLGLRHRVAGRGRTAYHMAGICYRREFGCGLGRGDCRSR